MIPNTEAAIFARMVQSEIGALTSDNARYFLSLKLSPADEERVDELSEKARSGSLTEGERQELESYLHIGALLGVMQSRARRVIKSDPSADSMRQ